MFLQSENVSELAVKYYLSDKSIYRILREMKKKIVSAGELARLLVSLVFYLWADFWKGE